jgi:hypothetical protein
MWPTLLTLWRTRSGKTPRKGSPRRRPACCRPHLEVLEDRTAPAALSYSTYLGSPVLAVAVQPGDTTGAVYVATAGSTLKLTNGGTVCFIVPTSAARALPWTQPAAPM